MRPRNKSWEGQHSLLMQVVLVSILFIVLFPLSSQEMVYFPDSHLFLAYAAAIHGGEALSLSSGTEILHKTLVTAPLYPLLLSGAGMLPLSTDAAVRLAHSLLGLLTLWLVMWSQRRLVPAFISGLLTVLVYRSAYVFFFSVLSEWTTLIILIWLYVAGTQFEEKRSPVTGAVAVACASLLPLTRAAFSLAPVAMLIVILVRSGSRQVPGYYCIVAAGLLPLLAMLGLNSIRLGEPSVISTNRNLFAVSVIVGQEQPQANDSDLYKEFIQRIKSNTKSCDGIGEHPVPSEFCYNDNLMEMEERFAHDKGISTAEVHRLMHTHSRRVLRHAPHRFVHYFLVNVRTLALRWPDFLILMALCTVNWQRRRPQMAPLCRSARMLVLINLLHLATVCTVQVPISRYVQLSSASLLLSLFLLTAAFIIGFFNARSNTPTTETRSVF